MKTGALDNRCHCEAVIFNNSAASIRFAFCSFSLCLCLLLTACLAGGIYPFGTTALLREDAIYQYVGFFGWFSNVLNGKTNLIYSLSKGLGGSTIGLFSYYLASPFNLIMGLFSPSDAPKVMSLLIIVKLCCMAAAQSWFISRRFRSAGYVCVLAGISYGLAMCNFVAGSNLMWLDGAILLPLICYSLNEFVQGRYPYMLSVLVGVAILVNWYSGYQLCVFSVFWLVYELIDHEVSNREAVRTFLRYVRYMVLGCFLSSVLFLPTVFDLLKTGSAPGSSQSGNFISSSNLFDLFSKWDLTDTSIQPDSSGLAGGLFTCSILFSSAFAFLAKEVNSKRSNKILLCIIIFIGICELIQPLSLLWTGFSRADSYNPRFHYLIIFILGVLFAKAQGRKEDSKFAYFTRFYYYPFVVIICFGLYCLGYYLHVKVLLFQLVSLLLTSLMLGYLSTANSQTRLKSRFVSLVVVVGLFSIESVYPIIATFKFDTSTPKLNVHEYAEYIDDSARLISTVSEGSSTRLERCGITYLGAGNRSFPTSESMALGTHGISHYSSAGRQSQKEILGSLGYCGVQGHRGITYYNSSIPVSDVLLGISDVLSSGQSQYVYGASQGDSEDSPFGMISHLSLRGKRSIAYAMSNAVDGPAFSSDSFANQEMLANSIFGVSDLYLSLSPDVDQICAVGNSERLLTYVVPQDGPLYVKVTSDAMCSISINDIPIQTVNDWEFSSNTVSLGSYKAGDTVVLKLDGPGAEALESASVDIRELNVASYSRLLDAAGNQAIDIDEHDDGHISMEVNSSGDDYCFISIPFEEGWAATNNGRSCEITNFHGFMAIRLSDGLNAIELNFQNSTILIGLVASLLSIGVLIVLIIKNGALGVGLHKKLLAKHNKRR